MSRKIFLISLIPALLLIGGYLALQVSLRTGTADNGKTGQDQVVNTQSTAAHRSEEGRSENADGVKKKQDKEQEGLKTKPVTTDEKPDAGNKKSLLDLRPLFIRKMQDLVKKSSNGLYNLSVGDLELDVLASTVSLHNVALRPDEQVVQRLKETGLLPQSVVSLSFEDLVIDGINLDDAINSKSMDYKLVRLVNPVVEIDRYGAGGNGGNSANFSQSFLKQMEKLAIEKLQVEGGHIAVHDKIKGETKKLENVRVLMQDILLNDATRNDKNRFLFAKEAQLEFHDFNMQTKNGLYNFKISDAFVYATEKRVELKNVVYSSPLSKEEFVAKQEKATEMYDVALPSVSITGIDWWPTFNGEEISAGNVEVKGGKLSVYLDRSLPPKNRMGNFPNQLLAKVPMKIEVDKVGINGLDILYEEYNPKSKQSGALDLSGISMDIANITNKESNHQPVVADLTALLMKQVPIRARFTFDVDKAEAGVFSALMQVDSFAAPIMNPIAKPLGLMEASRGDVHSFEVQMQGNEIEARGEVLMLYDQLRLSLLKKKEGKEELKKRHLFSFLANLFVLKNNNPWWLTGKKRKKEAYFQRDPEAGFMNLVWKTAFVGLLKTIGAPEKVAKKK